MNACGASNRCAATPAGADFATRWAAIRYIKSYPDWLIDYGKRYRQHRPISTGSAESAVEYVVDQRMKNKGHMRWSRQGANALLHVRCAVLNGIDMLNFMRWYPRDREHAYPTAPRVG